MCARTGRLQIRQRCVATCTKHSISTSRTPKCCGVLMRCVCSRRLRQRCVAMRRNDYALRDSNASLRARKMFYSCYADGAVATAMRRYIHVHFNISTSHALKKSVACVSIVYLCVRELGDCSYDSDASLHGRSVYLRRRYVATRYMRSWRL